MLKLFVPSKAPSHRQVRVAEELKFLLCGVIQRDGLPIEYDELDNLIKPAAPITITHLTVSADLRHAQVGVMPLGGIDKGVAVKFMQANAWYLRSAVAKQLKTRVMPELRFYLDDHFEQVAKIDALIAGVAK